MVNMRKNQQMLLLKRKPEPGFREIRINVELKQQENNIFSFPDLCKEAGIDLTGPKQKHCQSGSETDDNSAEFTNSNSDSDSDSNNNNGKSKKKNKNKKVSAEEDLPDEFQLNKPGDDFFKRILENSEKYADEEEEEQVNNHDY